LGLSQLQQLDEFLVRRRAIAADYDRAFEGTCVKPINHGVLSDNGCHLYVVRVPERDRVKAMMTERGINCQIHYKPITRFKYYQQKFGTMVGQCPVAEKAYQEILSLPMYPTLTEEDQDRVIQAVKELV
jgi:perosamine synthetase